MLKKKKTAYFTFLLIYFLAIISITHWIERDQTTLLLITYISAFMGYIFLLQDKSHPKILVNIGVIIRISLFFSLPSLSDDLYRFIWDGTLIHNGIHPFESLPHNHLNNEISGISLELYEKLNSPNYYTVYPPLNQLIFWIAAAIGDGNWLFSATVIRILLFVADIGSFFLLKSILKDNGKSPFLAYWFFLNPLIILEFVGNIHFEGLVVFFVLLGIYGFQKNKYFLSASGFGLAIATKLLPLIYLPFLFLTNLKNRKWWMAILSIIIALITFIPMLNQSFLDGISNSLDLYFRSFEFNASSYFFARWIGYLIYGYNTISFIGPLFFFLSFSSILFLSFRGFQKKWTLEKTFLFVLTSYLLFATTVHPWYVLPLIPIGIIVGYWYPIVWSFLIFFTYAGYNQTGFELPIFVVIIEYTFLFAFIFMEIRFKKQKERER